MIMELVANTMHNDMDLNRVREEASKVAREICRQYCLKVGERQLTVPWKGSFSLKGKNCD